MNGEFPPRIAEGLGGPPRLEPLTEDGLDERELQSMNRARDLTGYPRDWPLHPFLATCVRHPEMFDRYLEFGMNFLHSSKIPARERELVILRTGWLCDAPYEWGEHVAAGLDQGLTREEVERVKQGSCAEGWNALDRALLRAVEELHDTAMICDETWEALAQHLDERQLIELPVMIGQYHMTAFLQNSLRFAPGRDKHGAEVARESAT